MVNQQKDELVSSSRDDRRSCGRNQEGQPCAVHRHSLLCWANVRQQESGAVEGEQAQLPAQALQAAARTRPPDR